jgi:hypothetical protein
LKPLSEPSAYGVACSFGAAPSKKSVLSVRRGGNWDPILHREVASRLVIRSVPDAKAMPLFSGISSLTASGFVLVGDLSIGPGGSGGLKAHVDG